MTKLKRDKVRINLVVTGGDACSQTFGLSPEDIETAIEAIDNNPWPHDAMKRERVIAAYNSLEDIARIWTKK